MAHAVPSGATLDVYDLSDADLVGAGALPENLLDQINNIDPTDRPVQAMCPRVKTENVLDQWLKESLPSISDIDTGTIEGAEFEAETPVVPSRLINQQMIIRADVRVSDTARAVNFKGFSDAYAHQIDIWGETLGNKLERILLDPDVVSNIGAAGTARVMKNLDEFLGASSDTSATLGAGTGVHEMTEDDFNDALHAMWRNGAAIRTAVVDSNTIRHIQATFFGLAETVSSVNGRDALANRRVIDGESGTLYANIEFYRCPFGVVTLMVDRWMPTFGGSGVDASVTRADTRVYLLDRTKLALSWLRPMNHFLLGKSGDSTRGYIVGEVTLRVLIEKAHYMIAGAD